MKWAKIGKVVGAEGTTIIDRLEGTPYTVESRTRANGLNTWNPTSFYVLKDGENITVRHTLKDAKAVAQALYKKDLEGGNHG